MEIAIFEFLAEHPDALLTMHKGYSFDAETDSALIDVIIRVDDDGQAYKRVTCDLAALGQIQDLHKVIKDMLDNMYLELKQFILRQKEKHGD